MELVPAQPTILGDRVQLQQVIINLVMNGIEAMQSVTDRPRELVVRSGQDEPGQALISVADCGVGISAENVDQPLLHHQIQRHGYGTLDLPVVIDAHGGRLWATTCGPRGALFHFTIPDD
jgi:signal transduction histidine kinase